MFNLTSYPYQGDMHDAFHLTSLLAELALFNIDRDLCFSR